MSFEFQLTESDYRSAMAANVRNVAAASKKSVLIRATTAVYMLIGVAYGVIGGAFKSKGDSDDLFYVWAGQYVAPICALVLFAKLQRLQGKRASWFWIVGAAIVMMLLLAGPALFRLEHPDARAIFLALDPAVAWGSALLVFGTVYVLSLRRAVASLFARQQQLHGIKTITVQPDGIVIDEPLTSIFYRWPRFKKVVETGDVLLLYVSDLSFFIIPKARIEPAEYELLRSALRDNVERRISAFPVLPANGSANAN